MKRVVSQNKKKTLVSIVIPAYNEERRITSTLQQIIDYTTANENYDFEIIVVSDGSNDKTDNLVKKFPIVKLISYLINKGKGYALRTGVAKSNGEYIYICDVDLSTPIKELDKFLKYSAEYDCIIGSRALPCSKEHRSSKYRKNMGRIGNILINLFLDLDVRDSQCGFKLFSSKVKDIFLSVKANRWSFDIDFLYYLKRDGYRIKEVGVDWTSGEETKLKNIDYLKTLGELLGFWWRNVGLSKQFIHNIIKTLGAFGRYLVVGVTTNLLDIVLFSFLLRILHVGGLKVGGFELFPYQVVQSISYTTSVILNYSLNRKWSFQSKGAKRWQIIRYILMLIINYLVSILIITFLVEKFGFWEELAKFISIGAIISWNFFALKYFVYQK